jgi:hypothetical protein
MSGERLHGLGVSTDATPQNSQYALMISTIAALGMTVTLCIAQGLTRLMAGGSDLEQSVTKSPDLNQRIHCTDVALQ